MTTTMTTNGKLRRSLSDQIDRLDTILDGLAEALNESVAAAVRDAVGLAVREAVQAVLTEVLTNPAVLDKLRGTMPPPAAPAVTAPARPSWRERLRPAWGRVVAGALATRLQCRRLWGRARQGLSGLWERLSLLRRCRRQVLAAVGVGLVAGVVAYVAGPWLAALVSAVGGCAGTLAVQTWLWLRRTVLPSCAPAG
jgi:hypothetical protein